MLLFLLLIVSVTVSIQDVRKRHISNKMVSAICMITLLLNGIDSMLSMPFVIALFFGGGVFSAKIFAGGDVKLLLAYLIGIDVEWWSVTLQFIAGLGGILALGYLVVGYLSNTLESVRQKGLPYGVPIAIGGCLGVLLSTT